MAWLVNRVNHPVEISYEGRALIVPPYGQVQVDSVEKLGAVPKTVTIVGSSSGGGGTKTTSSRRSTSTGKKS